MKFRELVRLLCKVRYKAYPSDEAEGETIPGMQEGKSESLKKVRIIIEAEPLFLNKNSEEHVTKNLQKKMLVCSDSMVVLD